MLVRNLQTKGDYEKSIIEQDENLRLSIQNDQNVANARKRFKEGLRPLPTQKQKQTEEETVSNDFNIKIDALNHLRSVFPEDRAKLFINGDENTAPMTTMDMEYLNIFWDEVKPTLEASSGMTVKFFRKAIAKITAGRRTNYGFATDRTKRDAVNTLPELRRTFPSRNVLDMAIKRLREMAREEPAATRLLKEVVLLKNKFPTTGDRDQLIPRLPPEKQQVYYERFQQVFSPWETNPRVWDKVLSETNEGILRDLPSLYPDMTNFKERVEQLYDDLQDERDAIVEEPVVIPLEEGPIEAPVVPVAAVAPVVPVAAPAVPINPFLDPNAPVFAPVPAEQPLIVPKLVRPVVRRQPAAAAEPEPEQPNVLSDVLDTIAEIERRPSFVEFKDTDPEPLDRVPTSQEMDWIKIVAEQELRQEAIEKISKGFAKARVSKAKIEEAKQELARLRQEKEDEMRQYEENIVARLQQEERDRFLLLREQQKKLEMEMATVTIQKNERGRQGKVKVVKKLRQKIEDLNTEIQDLLSKQPAMPPSLELPPYTLTSGTVEPVEMPFDEGLRAAALAEKTRLETQLRQAQGTNAELTQQEADLMAKIRSFIQETPIPVTELPAYPVLSQFVPVDTKDFTKDQKKAYKLVSKAQKEQVKIQQEVEKLNQQEADLIAKIKALPVVSAEERPPYTLTSGTVEPVELPVDETIKQRFSTLAAEQQALVKATKAANKAKADEAIRKSQELKTKAQADSLAAEQARLEAAITKLQAGVRGKVTKKKVERELKLREELAQVTAQIKALPPVPSVELGPYPTLSQFVEPVEVPVDEGLRQRASALAQRQDAELRQAAAAEEVLSLEDRLGMIEQELDALGGVNQSKEAIAKMSKETKKRIVFLNTQRSSARTLIQRKQNEAQEAAREAEREAVRKAQAEEAARERQYFKDLLEQRKRERALAKQQEELDKYLEDLKKQAEEAEEKKAKLVTLVQSKVRGKKARARLEIEKQEAQKYLDKVLGEILTEQTKVTAQRGLLIKEQEDNDAAFFAKVEADEAEEKRQAELKTYEENLLKAAAKLKADKEAAQKKRDEQDDALAERDALDEFRYFRQAALDDIVRSRGRKKFKDRTYEELKEEYDKSAFVVQEYIEAPLPPEYRMGKEATKQVYQRQGQLYDRMIEIEQERDAAKIKEEQEALAPIIAGKQRAQDILKSLGKKKSEPERESQESIISQLQRVKRTQSITEERKRDEAKQQAELEALAPITAAKKSGYADFLAKVGKQKQLSAERQKERAETLAYNQRLEQIQKEREALEAALDQAIQEANAAAEEAAVAEAAAQEAEAAAREAQLSKPATELEQRAAAETPKRGRQTAPRPKPITKADRLAKEAREAKIAEQQAKLIKAEAEELRIQEEGDATMKRIDDWRKQRILDNKDELKRLVADRKAKDEELTKAKAIVAKAKVKTSPEVTFAAATSYRLDEEIAADEKRMKALKEEIDDDEEEQQRRVEQIRAQIAKRSEIKKAVLKQADKEESIRRTRGVSAEIRRQDEERKRRAERDQRRSIIQGQTLAALFGKKLQQQEKAQQLVEAKARKAEAKAAEKAKKAAEKAEADAAAKAEKLAASRAAAEAKMKAKPEATPVLGFIGKVFNPIKQASKQVGTNLRTQMGDRSFTTQEQERRAEAPATVLEVALATKEAAAKETRDKMEQEARRRMARSKSPSQLSKAEADALKKSREVSDITQVKGLTDPQKRYEVARIKSTLSAIKANKPIEDIRVTERKLYNDLQNPAQARAIFRSLRLTPEDQAALDFTESDIVPTVGRGITLPPKTWANLGKYLINETLLEQGALQIKTPNGSGVSGFVGKKAISDNLQAILMDLIETKKLRGLSDLDDDERKMVETLLTKAGLAHGLGVNKIHKPDEDAIKVKRFALVQGIYDAGNNSNEVKEELRSLIHYFIKTNRLDKRQGMEALSEL